MTILIILIAILILAILLAVYSESFLPEIIGVMGAAITGFYLIFHLISWLSVEYSFNQWVLQRQAFVETLNESRKNGRELESAAIIQSVSAWNQDLAEKKYDNNTFLLGDYVDDRVADLKPIK